MYETLYEIFRYSLPAIVVGAITYFFWTSHFKNEENRRNFLIAKDNQKVTTPIRLQAYERIILLLERSNPRSLVTRLNVSDNINIDEYRSFLIKNINREFEHNFSQQLYVSQDVWDRVLESKILCINMINLVFTSVSGSKNPIKDFKDEIFKLTLKNNNDPTHKALFYLKKEARSLYKF